MKKTIIMMAVLLIAVMASMAIAAEAQELKTESKMCKRIQIRRDISTNWTAKNSILADGELGCEKDTGGLKAGNGGTGWNDLGYLISPSGGDVVIKKLSTTVVQMNLTTKQNLLTVPAGKECIITNIILRKPTISLDSSAVSFGFNASANDWEAYQQLSGMILPTDLRTLFSNTVRKLGNSADTFGFVSYTQNNGSLVVDVFGYLIDV